LEHPDDRYYSSFLMHGVVVDGEGFVDLSQDVADHSAFQGYTKPEGRFALDSSKGVEAALADRRNGWIEF
jgi:hypothetical protein